MTTVAIQLLIESGRTLGAGAPAESEPLHIIPIIFVSIASKCHFKDVIESKDPILTTSYVVFAKGSLMFYCLAYRRFPSVHVFYVSY